MMLKANQQETTQVGVRSYNPTHLFESMLDWSVELVVWVYLGFRRCFPTSLLLVSCIVLLFFFNLLFLFVVFCSTYLFRFSAVAMFFLLEPLFHLVPFAISNFAMTPSIGGLAWGLAPLLRLSPAFSPYDVPLA